MAERQQISESDNVDKLTSEIMTKYADMLCQLDGKPSRNQVEFATSAWFLPICQICQIACPRVNLARVLLQIC